MSKHTPGQWYWDFDRDGKASLRSDTSGEPIMDEGQCPSIEDRCLIAAAPDLLEALESLADDYLRKDGLGFDLLASTKMFAAIRKAKGESQ
jgi:hypothetical protein